MLATWRGKCLVGLLLLFLFLVVVVYAWIPGYVMKILNTTARPGPYQVSAEAAKLHKSLFVADLHCDSLLWGADLTERHDKGHVDFPRLLEGQVGLQVFAACTYVPITANLHYSPRGWDILPLLHLIQGWPLSACLSSRERALYMARRLEAMAGESQDSFRLIKYQEDLTAYLKDRREDPQQSAGLLSIEGLYCLEHDLENLRVFYHAGYRMMSPTHLPDSALGGSAHGLKKGGLTDFGRRAILFMEQLGILIDLAHASPKLIDDILALATKPVISSHGGVQGLVPSKRNLSDAHLRAIAATGGVIGIGFWKEAVGEASVEAIAQSIRYTADLVGVDHVALGSDFDGAVRTAITAAGMPVITESLLEQGFSKSEIQKIMGGNVLRLLQEQLPSADKATGQSAIPIPE